MKLTQCVPPKTVNNLNLVVRTSNTCWAFVNQHITSRVKIGRKKWVKFLMPAMSAITAFGYYSTHTHLHHKMRDLYAADEPDGSRVELSDHLRNLIKDVFLDIKSHINNPANRFEELLREKDFKPKPIKWFASATFEPITYGSTKLDTGSLIGVPTFYNYTKVDDIPNSAFAIYQMKFIRSPQDPELQQKERLDFEALTDRTPIVGHIAKIDRTSPIGMDYASSLVLTDNAKKFSLAREMFLADTARPLLKTLLIIFSSTLATTTGAITGFMSYNIFGSSLDTYYAKEADEKARKVSPQYEEGAIEYYAKRALRNHCLGIR